MSGNANTVEVRLFATFRENREKIIHMDCADGMDGYTIIESLNIPEKDVAIFLINGRHNKLDAKVNPNDIIALFPPVGGG